MSAKQPHQTSLPSTSSVADSPAKISASPAAVPVWTAPDLGFGGSSCESFATYDPGSSSWRTSQLSLIEGCTPYSGRWPKAGTTLSGTAYRLQPLAPPTGGTGSSWSRGEYPTPSATPFGSSNNGSPHDGRREEYATKGNPSLQTWASSMWPTATQGDSKMSGSRVGNADTKAHAGTSLTDKAVRQWPTPTTNDAKNNSSPPSQMDRDGMASATAGHRHPTTCTHGGDCRWRLNPRFVESLMGFPADWTNVD